MNPLKENSNFIIKSNTNEDLNAEFTSRYPRIPSEYLAFIKSFSSLINASETTWFNSISDFNETNEESDFKWNEFELQSLEAFEGDLNGQLLVTQFWDAHLPIVLSVKNGYAFFAIGVSEENFGKIYFGEEPEYEEVEWIADDFTSFLEKITAKTLPEYLQNLF
ncbi:SMI1/KNR4 family protein [Sphingobacterium bovistauri]|uniref:SMI1/KNR4 family protein n=1 Tax=Sphingobacterium bovistauri TaxID=2781959 RepID=A0ABS7Z8N8_9SPHI|nr:SMI1/KNR4 family protein [Sphingobacterium bovistauri]MCA5005230.1 SMI1/KNR4 family protein [Sphingobacterium bovistauri]